MPYISPTDKNGTRSTSDPMINHKHCNTDPDSYTVVIRGVADLYS